MPPPPLALPSAGESRPNGGLSSFFGARRRGYPQVLGVISRNLLTVAPCRVQERTHPWPRTRPMDENRRRRTGHPRLGSLVQHHEAARAPRLRSACRVRGTYAAENADRELVGVIQTKLPSNPGRVQRSDGFQRANWNRSQLLRARRPLTWQAMNRATRSSATEVDSSCAPSLWLVS